MKDSVNPGSHFITDLASLHDAMRRRLGSSSALSDVRIPRRGDVENAAWTKRLRRYQAACGCESGAAAVALVVLAFLLIHFLAGGGPGWPAWVGIGLGAAFVGKLVGLGWARLRLHQLEREIANAVLEVQ